MWIMVAGPYSSNGASEAQKARNLDALNRAALRVFDMGHLPIIGVNLGLPITAVAPERTEQILMPISLALVERCDACLRVGGASRGADAEVASFEAAGKPVYHRIEDLPAPAD